MREKKEIILLSGLIAILNIIVLVILQLRLYHSLYIFGGENQFLADLRECCIVVAGGLFTSSCVTCIISIREYIKERTDALRNLLRLLGNVKAMYDQIRYYIPDIPTDVAIPYLISKHDKMREGYKEIIDFCKNNNIPVIEDAVKKYDIELEKEKKFREAVWEKTPDYIRNLYNDNDQKEKYLNKKCPEIEDEYKNRVQNFVKSLGAFSDFDVYLVQEVFDKINFFFHKENKDMLKTILFPHLVSNIELIKYYHSLCIIESDETYIDSLNVLDILNKELLRYDKSTNEVYSIPSFHIDYGKALIKNMLNRKKDAIPMPEIKKYSVHYFQHFPRSDFGATADILFDI